MIRKIFLLSTAVFLLQSCSRQELPDWFSGEWKARMKGGTFYESWHKKEANIWEGTGTWLDEGDTIFQEKITLFTSDSGTYYQVKASREHSVAFYLINIENPSDSLDFVNEANDFPQHIVYYRLSKDSMHVRIYGDNHGEFQEEHFYFSRR